MPSTHDIEVAVAKIRAFAKAHPEAEARYLEHLSEEARPHAHHLSTIVLDENNDAAVVKVKEDAYKATLSEEIVHELNAHRAEIAHAVGIHFTSPYDVEDAVRKVRAFVKAHPDATDKYVASLSKDAQTHAKHLSAILLDEHNCPATVKSKSDAYKAKLPKAVVDELNKHRADIAKAAGIATEHDVEEAIKKVRAYVKAHPDAEAKYLATLSDGAKAHAHHLSEILMDEHNDAATVHYKSQSYKHSLSQKIVDEIESHRSDIAKAAGI